MKVAHQFTKDDLRELYDQYFDSIRGFLYYKCGDMDLAEDLVQETFIKIWAKKGEIRPETVKSLLYTIAGNLLKNHFSHQSVVREHQKNNVLSVSSDLSSPQFVMEEKEFEDKLNKAISRLPEDCREVFLMNRVEKLKYKEIAERLDLSVKAIEKRMSKTLALLKEYLGMRV